MQWAGIWKELLPSQTHTRKILTFSGLFQREELYRQEVQDEAVFKQQSC